MTIKDATTFTTGHDPREDQPFIRRLFEVNYTCSLCGQNHMAETYVPSNTNNLDELNAAALRVMRIPRPPSRSSKPTCASSTPSWATSNSSSNNSGTPPTAPTWSSTP